MDGTGQMPRSTGSQPVERRPAKTALRTISPDLRVSRPTRIGPRPRYVPKAPANAVNNWGVRVSPTTPRTPEMLILSEWTLLMRLPGRIELRGFDRDIVRRDRARGTDSQPRP